VTLVTALAFVFAIFTLVPIAWIVINSTKTQANIFETFGFWFARPFSGSTARVRRGSSSGSPCR